jgi:hypothetical protein
MNVVKLWPTELAVFKIPEPKNLNKKLKAIILDLESRFPNFTTEFWRSYNFWEIEEAPVQTLKQYLVANANQYIDYFFHDKRKDFKIQGWANVKRSNEWHVRHTHGYTSIIVNYYVNLPVEQDSKLYLFDPRPAANVVRNYSDGEALTLRVAEGDMILMPGFVEHQVSPYGGPEERISISTNVYF